MAVIQGFFVLALDQFMEVQTVPSVAVFLLVTSAIWYTVSIIGPRYVASSRHDSPPGPWAWPVIGNLPTILYGGQPHQALAKLAQRYGSVMAVSLGPGSKVVVLSGADVVKEALVKKADATSNRRIPPLLDVAFSTKGSVLWENGSTWKTHRRITLTGFRRGLNKSSAFSTTIKHSLQRLRSKLEQRKGQHLNPRDEISAAVTEVVCSLCFGHCLDVSSDSKISELLQAQHEVSRGLSGISMAHIFPCLFHTPFYRQLRNDFNKLTQFLKDIVSDHSTSKGNSNTSDSCLNDVTDLYLHELMKQKENNGDAISADNIWRTMLDLLATGTETTSATLVWGILYMCHNPEIQKKVQSEIENNIVLDDFDIITYNQRTALPFTQATILELLRCASVAPLSVPRVTSHDVTINHFTIPQGTEVWMNVWAIHRDPNVWRDPDKFNPERFLDDSGEIDVQMKDSLMAFGEGRRMCLGRCLAETKLFTYFSNLLRWFTFQFPDDCRATPNVNKGHFGLIYTPPPFDVILTPRERKN